MTARAEARLAVPRDLPANLDAEAAVIGGVLVWNRALAEVSDVLGPDDFYSPRHRELYAAMLRLAAGGRPIDPVTLEHEVRSAGRAWPDMAATVGEMVCRVPTAANAVHYAWLVVGAAQLRALAAAGAGVWEAALEPGADPCEVQERAERDVMAAGRERGRRPVLQAGALVRGALESMARNEDRPDAVSGVSTGFADYDALTGGLHGGELTVLASRPSVGKTSLAVNVALHAAVEHKTPVLFFSLEMSAEAIGLRLACSLGRVDSLAARTGKLDVGGWRSVYAAANRIEGAPLSLDDNARSTLPQVRARSRRWRSDRAAFPAGGHERGLVVVDYLQLVKLGVRAETREQEVSEVTAALKELSKELSLPVLALCQLGRQADQREGPPRLSDLRESGGIEQHADNVAFLHVPRRTGARAARGTVTELILGKQRNGPTGTCTLVFLRQPACFVAYTAEPAASAPAGTHWQDRAERAGGDDA